VRSRLMPEVRSRLMPEEVREVRVGYGCAGAAGGVWLRWCCAGAALVLHTWHRSLPDALQGRALQLVRSWSTARLVPRERALQLGRVVLPSGWRCVCCVCCVCCCRCCGRCVWWGNALLLRILRQSGQAGQEQRA